MKKGDCKVDENKIGYLGVDIANKNYRRVFKTIGSEIASDLVKQKLLEADIVTALEAGTKNVAFSQMKHMVL